MSTILRNLVLACLLTSSVFGQTKVREGSGTQGALPTAQGGAPAGGSTGQILTKSNSTDFAYVWADPVSGGGNVSNNGTPSLDQVAIWTDATHIKGVTTIKGGTTGQVLTKSSGTDYAYAWADPSGGGTPGGSDTEVQFNDSGSFGGSSGLTWDNNSLVFSIGLGISMSSPSDNGTMTVNGKPAISNGSGNSINFGDINSEGINLTPDASNGLNLFTPDAQVYIGAASFNQPWVLINPSLVLQPTTTPSILTEGLIWEDSTEHVLYWYDGSNTKEIVDFPIIGGFTAHFSRGGAAIQTGDTIITPWTCPYSGTITGYSISANTGTCTLKTWKKSNGTAIPTIADVISTSGVSISTGTHIRSSTVSDFTTTTVTAGDMFMAQVTATSGPTDITFQVEITR